MSLLRRWVHDTRGNVAMIFSFAIIPLFMGIGIAVDYSRAASVRTAMQGAADSAALYAAKSLVKRDTVSTVESRRVFNAGIAGREGNVTSFAVQQDATRIRVTATMRVPVTVLGIMRQNGMEVSVSAEVPVGTQYLEVALALDNTGSMAALGKMAALQAAARDFLAVMEQDATSSTGYVVGLAPFNTQVKLDTANRFASWLRFDPLSAEPVLRVGQFGWQGCVSDRDTPFNIRVSAPGGGATRYPAATCQYAGLQAVAPLTRDFNALRTSIDAMVPTGNTNTTIGLTWGYNLLRREMPLGGSARLPSSTTQKVIIFLTDGLNTEDRFGTTPATMDAATRSLCTEIKDANVRLITIRVIEGNEALLRDCASTPADFYDISDPAQLRPLFQRLARELTRLRLSV